MSTPLATLILAAANVELLALLVVAAAATVSVLVKTLTRRPFAWGTRATRRRAATPSPFSYWYALVPFEDHTGVMTIPLAGFRRRLGDERNVRFKRELVRIHPDELRDSIANPSGEPQF